MDHLDTKDSIHQSKQPIPFPVDRVGQFRSKDRSTASPADYIGNNLLDFEKLKANLKTSSNRQQHERNNRPDNRAERRRRKAEVNYLPVSYEKTVADFPTNKEIQKYNEEHGTNYPANSAVLRTRLVGDDALFVSELYQLKKQNDKGELESSLSGAEIMTKILSKCIVSWTFKNIATGEAWPVDEAHVRFMLTQEDFSYLVEQFSPVLESMLGKDENGDGDSETNPETAPVLALPEAEKN